MATYTKQLLSGSTSGKGIKVTQAATAGDLIHTAVGGANAWDEIWLWAVNSQTAAVKLTLEWGQATAPDGNIEITIPGESGLMLIVPGLLLNGGLTVKAFAASANVIMIYGFVNAIT